MAGSKRNVSSSKGKRELCAVCGKYVNTASEGKSSFSLARKEAILESNYLSYVGGDLFCSGAKEGPRGRVCSKCFPALRIGATRLVKAGESVSKVQGLLARGRQHADSIHRLPRIAFPNLLEKKPRSRAAIEKQVLKAGSKRSADIGSGAPLSKMPCADFQSAKGCATPGPAAVYVLAPQGRSTPLSFQTAQGTPHRNQFLCGCNKARETYSHPVSRWSLQSSSFDWPPHGVQNSHQPPQEQSYCVLCGTTTVSFPAPPPPPLIPSHRHSVKQQRRRPQPDSQKAILYSEVPPIKMMDGSSEKDIDFLNLIQLSKVVECEVSDLCSNDCHLLGSSLANFSLDWMVVDLMRRAPTLLKVLMAATGTDKLKKTLENDVSLILAVSLIVKIRNRTDEILKVAENLNQSVIQNQPEVKGRKYPQTEPTTTPRAPDVIGASFEDLFLPSNGLTPLATPSPCKEHSPKNRGIPLCEGGAQHTQPPVFPVVDLLSTSMLENPPPTLFTTDANGGEVAQNTDVIVKTKK